MTTVLYINVQFVQPVCCCLVQGKKVTIALCVGAEVDDMFCLLLGFTTAACCIFAKSHLREVPSSASCVQSDRGLFVVDLDEPNSVDEGRVQEGVCSECLCTSVGGSN